MGHISLPVPVVNIALFKVLATNLSKLLGIPTKKLEDVIYLRTYVVVDNGLTNLLEKKSILEKKLDLHLINDILQEIIQDEKTSKEVIAQAKELSQNLDGKKEKNEEYYKILEVKKGKTPAGTEKEVLEMTQKISEAYKILSDKKRKENSNDSEANKIFLEDYLDFLEKHRGIKIWTGAEALRELLMGINIKEELAKVKEAVKEVPQKTNQEKLKFLHGSNYKKNEIKSLLQSLSGKEGILRRYSLGKRVDYSARSVIVPNPNLLIDQIGLPVKMALTLYKPFIIQKILKEKVVFTVKEAEQLFYQKDPVVFPILNEIIKGHPVLANRAPSLHRLSIQGFYPQLTLGNSIELHPLITTAMNADFDGDQIAIHLPMTTKTCEEVKELILSTHHIIDPKNGHLITIPSQDMILGNIWKSHEKGKIGLHDLVAIPATLVDRNFSTSQNQFLFTTLGKIVFNQILPASFPYHINDLKKYNTEMKIVPRPEMLKFLDQLKKVSFDYATSSGISIPPFELEGIISNKEKILTEAYQKENQITKHFSQDSGARASDESLTQIFGMRVYGAVKGMIDIALKTAEAGYLTRRLVESTQNLAIISPDCGINTGMLFVESGLPLSKRVYGRYLAQDISDKEEKTILTRNTLLLEKEMKIIQAKGITEKCYGLDLSKPGEAIALGTAVGVIAAQSLGEPGTQLTMRTFHSGGIAGDEDITQGLPKVKQIFDNIKPDKEEKTILAKDDGKIISIEEKIIKQKNDQGKEIIYPLGKKKKARVNQGDLVKKGERLTGGKVDLEEFLEVMGRNSCQEYIKEEVRKVYENQGIEVNEKHIEIFARQMLSKVEITNSGDSNYLVGDLANYHELEKNNQKLLVNKKQPASFKNIISSLKDLASHPDSFLAGISFQNTLKSLVNYSLYQPVDYLRGCKENLIAGQLIPVGTGFKEREKFQRKSTRET
ncbi:3666_t:CDS:2 [Funneliformis geosporum]|nr:3666_t:CDS:2 [Funneliformis geosporum]